MELSPRTVPDRARIQRPGGE